MLDTIFYNINITIYVFINNKFFNNLILEIFYKTIFNKRA